MQSFGEQNLKKGSGSLKSVASIATKNKGTLFKAIFSGLGAETLGVLLAVLILLFIPCMFLSSIPVGNLFQTSETTNVYKENISSKILPYYNNEVNNSKSQILAVINDKYSCNAKELNGNNDIDTNTCSIHIQFSPGKSEIENSVSAYVNAAYGTLAYFGVDTRNELTQRLSGTGSAINYEGAVLENNDGRITLTNEAQDFYSINSNELTNLNDEKSTKGLEDIVFSYEKNESLWSFDDFHIEDKIHFEKVETGTDDEGLPIYENQEVTESAWIGSITVPISIDMSLFKKDEIEECIELVMEENNLTYDEASTKVFDVLNGYYENLMTD